MDKKKALSLGRKLALRFGLIGILSGYFVIVCFFIYIKEDLITSLTWVAEDIFTIHAINGAFSILLCAFFIGPYAAVDILIMKKNELCSGLKYGVIILFSSGALAIINHALFECIGGSKAVFTSLLWISKFIFSFMVVLGLLPSVLLGLRFGWLIKNQANNDL
jgi:hypothetical protein